MRGSLVPPIDRKLRDLLRHLSMGDPRADLPRGVGPKTVRLALDNNLVEKVTDRISGEIKLVITQKGSALHAEEFNFHRTPQRGIITTV